MICQAKNCYSVALPSGLCGFHEEQAEDGEAIERKLPRGRPQTPNRTDYRYVQVAKRPGFRRCLGINKHKTQCVNQARPDSDFCRCHQPGAAAWECARCGQMNARWATECGRCQHPKSGSKRGEHGL